MNSVASETFGPDFRGSGAMPISGVRGLRSKFGARRLLGGGGVGKGVLAGARGGGRGLVVCECSCALHTTAGSPAWLGMAEELEDDDPV